MELLEKVDSPVKRKIKKLRSNTSNWNPFWFFVLISSLPALILTITFWLSGIKTIFYQERGGLHHRWIKGYISVFLFLLLYITLANIILYVFLFLAKGLRQKKDKSQRKKVGKHLLLFFSNQLVFNLFLVWLWKGRTKSTSIAIMLISFLLMIINGFFIHYFFSKPVMKLLIKKYPYYFPRFFYQETELIMKVDGMEFKKTQTAEWATTFTGSLVNLWILSQLFYLKLSNK